METNVLTFILPAAAPSAPRVVAVLEAATLADAWAGLAGLGAV